MGSLRSKAFADYYGGDARKAFAGVKSPALQDEFAKSSAAASKAMADLATWLQSQRATQTQDFALGAARFSRMLSMTEGVDVPLETLEAAGKADLARNRTALVAACGQFAPGATVPACVAKMNADKPANNDPVAEARKQIPELRAFVLSNDIVSIPDNEQALVEESPPYNRQNSAYIDPPGPFEKGVPSIYYISPPDPAWSKQMQADFIPGKDDLLFTTVHEVMPGHFLQFRHANHSPSLFGRLFVGYAFAEGWAHYAEEMMWEAGLHKGDPETHIGQLSNALLRDCRFLSAIGLHARGMTQEQSRKMFVEQCYQDEGNARQQSARGTYDPAYLNYTMGKLMIRRLRADWTARHGGRASWKAFHDTFLSLADRRSRWFARRCSAAMARRCSNHATATRNQPLPQRSRLVFGTRYPKRKPTPLTERSAMSKLHLVFGGRVSDPQTLDFNDTASLDVVGIFPDYASAEKAWRAAAQRTVDDAEMKYVIVHMHRLLEPDLLA